MHELIVQGHQIRIHSCPAHALFSHENKSKVEFSTISESGSSAGIGFAVPVDVVNQVVPQLIARGKMPRPGIGITALPEEAAAGLGVIGVIIERVQPNSAAERAGLVGIDYRNRTLGDIILAVDGQAVTNIVDLARLMQNKKIGQTVTLKVQRDDVARSVEVNVMDIS